MQSIPQTAPPQVLKLLNPKTLATLLPSQHSVLNRMAHWYQSLQILIKFQKLFCNYSAALNFAQLNKRPSASFHLLFFAPHTAQPLYPMCPVYTVCPVYTSAPHPVLFCVPPADCLSHVVIILYHTFCCLSIVF